MKHTKITVVGAGNVGATAAFIAAEKGLGEVVLIDIVEGLSEGKALDMAQAKAVYPAAGRVYGTRDWDAATGSDVVIVTSGLARKPGMSRDDLLAKNAHIVKSVTEQIVRTSPEAIIIVVSNPLDVMTYVAAKVSRFDTRRVMGMAGVLDSARFACFIAEELGVYVGDICGVLMGGHGDDMVPLPRYTTVSGVPLTELMAADRIEALVERTRKGGIEIVNLLGTSAYYAPAAGAVRMAEAILKNTQQMMSCCVYCDGAYGVRGEYVGVPAILGAGGLQKVVELELTAQEQAMFDASAAHVRELTEKVNAMI